MILPTKGLSPRDALLSVGAGILRSLDEPKTVSRLWSEASEVNSPNPQITFDWFILALDLLFMLCAVEYRGGLVVKNSAELEE